MLSAGKGGKNPKQNRNGQSADQDDEMDEAEGDELSEEQNRKYAAAVLKSIANILQKYPLKDQIDALRACIETLAEVVIQVEPSKERGTPCLAALSLKCLHETISSSHGKPVNNAALAFMRLTPTFFQSAATRANSIAFVRCGHISQCASFHRRISACNAHNDHQTLQCANPIQKTVPRAPERMNDNRSTQLQRLPYDLMMFHKPVDC
eukprot:6340320-Pyramimonas_sp.AAC.1